MDPKLSGLVAAWDTGDAVVRRALLATLFSDIHISEGRVKATHRIGIRKSRD